MNPSRLFILRPVATTLLMVAILLAGIVAYRVLPLSALPEVDYPTIQVVTLYPGASPDVMTSSVTAPLERQFGQMPGLNQMSSASSGGASVITLQFSLELSLDVAEQEVQAAINASGSFLPTDLPNPPIYNKVNPADTPIITLALTSQTLPLPKLEDLADTRIAQKISQLPGVGLVSISGGQRPAVRIQVNPKALAAYGLSLDDVRTAIGNANTNQAKGSFDGPTRASTIDANDQLKIGRRIPAADHRLPQRRGDPRAGRRRCGRRGREHRTSPRGRTRRRRSFSTSSGSRAPTSSRSSIASRSCCRSSQASLPSAVDVALLTDRTITIRASVQDVQFELLLAVALVVLVIFLFLRNVPATIIPSVAVPLSLVGTFGVMYLAGFSINNLTLMALTIATGFVVDDAIVVIENIARYIEDGESPLEAALKGTQQIGFTIISLTFSLIAVLIPLLFMGDVVGRLFREFAITLAVSILISAVVSLTLTPMMCAKLLRHTPPERQGRFYRWSGDLFERVIARYGRMLNWVLDRQGATLLVALAHARAHRRALHRHSQGLLPGAGHRAPSRASPKHRRRSRSPRWRSASRRWRSVVLEDPAVASLTSFIGVDGTNATLNSGRMLINLKPRDQREHQRDRGHPAPAAEARRRSTASRSTCSRCRT